MSKYAGNGQFKINKLNLTYTNQSETKKSIDLSMAYIQVDLYESVFNPTMSGAVSIVDSYNMVDILPLYGNEKIEIDFNTQGADAHPVQFTGVVYKISEKHRITEHSSGYVIYFISQEAIESERTNVQRGFKDTTSNVTKKIFSRINVSGKLLNVVDTHGIDIFTFGTFKPIQAITQLSNYSYSTNNEFGYLFYEDNKQFNFVPLQHLYQQDSISAFRSRPKGIYDDPTQRAQEVHGTIQHLKLMEENSYLDRIMEGQHGSTFLRYDLYSKDMQIFQYDKKTFFDPAKSLGTIPYKKDIDISYDDKISMRYGNHSNILMSGLGRGVAQKIEIDTIRAEITVYGDSNLRSGECVDINLPKWNTDQKSIKDMISGKFLLSSIHHQLVNHSHYLQTMMVQKEAYNKQ